MSSAVIRTVAQWARESPKLDKINRTAYLISKSLKNNYIMYEFDEIGLKFKNRQLSRNCHNKILDNNCYNDDYSILSMMITYVMSLLRNKT